MFHDVVPPGCEDASGFPGRDAARYKVTPQHFAAHIDAILSRLGWATASASLVITFDDGGESALRAADVLENRRLRGWFFVTTGYIGHRGFLDARGLRDLDARGHVVGSHSRSHPLRMAHCSSRQLSDEWVGSRDDLTGILGHPVLTASVPGGDYAEQVAVAAGAAGFTTLFTSEPTRPVVHVGPVAVRGRFVVRRGTKLRTLSAHVAGSRWPAMRQFVGWNLRKGLKHATGWAYLDLRRWLLRHGDDVSWGDTKS
jgi:peptidoglycan/xylan/chitin deacetylase (PgdA/CDA1 family)